MTKEQIQALIDAKIAGQGSAVDVGGALPTILSEILNLASNPPVPQKRVLSILSTVQNGTVEEALAAIRLDGEQVDLETLIALPPDSFVITCDISGYSGSVYVPTFVSQINEGGETRFLVFAGYDSAAQDSAEEVSIFIQVGATCSVQYNTR